MSVTRILAQMTVTDLDRAVAWYATVLDHEPDHRPMDGLVEFHLGAGFGIQVWLEPDRAGRSAMVLDESDLDALLARLNAAGVANDGAQDVTSSRVVQLADPDGNRVVFSGPFASA